MPTWWHMIGICGIQSFNPLLCGQNHAYHAIFVKIISLFTLNYKHSFAVANGPLVKLAKTLAPQAGDVSSNLTGVTNIRHVRKEIIHASS